MKGDINVDFVMAVMLFVSVYAMLYMLLPAATISFKKTPDPLWTASHYFADALMTSPGIPPNWGAMGEVQRLGLAYGDNVTSYPNILDAKKIGAIQGQTCSLLKSKTDTLLDFSIAVDLVNASAGASNLLGDGWDYRTLVTIDNTANNNSLTDYQVLVSNPVYNETGLVGSWHFDEGYGNYTSDGSGTGNDGAYYGENRNDGTLVNGPTRVEGRHGSAVYFPGQGTYVDAGNSSALNLSDSLTIMAWVKTTDSTPGEYWNTIVSKDQTDYPNKGWRLVDRIGYGQVMMGNGTSYATIVANWIADGSWHHIAATLKSEKNVSLFIDGAEVGNTTLVGEFVPSDNQLVIGGKMSGHNYTGTVDSVRYFNRGLALDEIRTEMNSSKPASVPVGAWEFDEGTGTTAKDTHIWTAGKYNSGLGFDGNDSYVKIPDSSSNSMTGEVSVEAWVKYDEWRNVGIVWKHSYNYILYGPEGETIRFNVWNTTGTSSGAFFPTTLMTLGTWHHIAGVFGADKQARLYLDGAAVGTPGDAIYGSIRDNAGDVYIGVRPDYIDTASGHHNGSIDEVRIYNRSLSAAEVLSHYQASAKPNYADLRFTAGDGATLLSHWKEADGKFWVKVPAIPSLNTTTVYAYYGNPDANSTSDGTATFSFFDDFVGTSLNTSKWDADADNYSISDGILRINAGGIGLNSPLSVYLNNGYALEGKMTYYVTATSYGGTLSGISSEYTQNNNAGVDATILYMKEGSSLNVGAWIGSGSSTEYDILGGGTVFTSTNNVWYVLGEKIDSSGVKLTRDRVTQNTYSFSWVKNLKYLSLGGFDGLSSYNIQDTGYDWVLVRKYSATEPTAYMGTSQTGGGVGNNCNYRKRLNFTNAWNSENLVNFPALIKLNSSRINYSSTGATDVRFYDSDGSTLLSKETELWNSSGDSYVWVKVPQIDANTNTDYIYAYYDCSDVNPDDKNNVWDSNSMMVQHFGETSGTHYDSTPYGNNGTANGGVVQGNASGKIDGADVFDGIDDYVNVGKALSLNVSGSAITISAWVKPKNYAMDPDMSTIVTKSVQYYFQINGSGYLAYASSDYVYSANTIPLNQWSHVAVTVNSTGGVKFYINGNLDAVRSQVAPGNYDSCVGIGANLGTSCDFWPGYNRRFNGTIDEVQIANISRNASWIKASYLSGNDSFIAYEGEQIGGWAADNCGYRKKINFTNIWNNENLTNFPVLIKLSQNRIDYSKTSASDIRFYDADGTTLLSKETELWNSSGDSYVWVKVPRIDAGSNIDYIYAYYSCANTNADDRTNVWDSNFKMVQHLDEKSGGSVYDSTTYANNGTVYNATQNAIGAIEGAGGFDGNYDYIDVGNGSSIKLTGNAVTIEAWVNISGDGVNWGRIVLGGSVNVAYTLTKNNGADDKILWRAKTSGTNNDALSTSALSRNVWHHVVAVYDGANSLSKLYIDGNFNNSAVQSGNLVTDTKTGVIGGETANHSGNEASWFNGTLDEVRISSAVRSAGWINASYLSESDNFASYGSEEGVGITNRVGNNCNYRKRLGFNNYWDQENLTNFPALVKINSTRIDYSKTGQYDIRFYDSNGVTLLSKETEKWNSSGDSYVWVKVPQIDANSNADYIYAYYGCSDANLDNKANVWDSNFKLVQHLGETSGTHYDSSLYGSNGTISGTVIQGNASGKIDGADVFDGSTGYVNNGNSSVLNIPDAITITGWLKMNTYRLNTYAGIVHKENTVEAAGGCGTNYALATSWWDPRPDFFITTTGGSTCQHFQGTTYMLNDTWYHVAGTYNASTGQAKIYLNGRQENSVTYAGNITISPYSVTIGKGNNFWNGSVDEIRILNVSRSAYWINATYLSENDNFIAYGTEETSSSTQNNCNYRKRINITNSWNSESLTDFPLLIKLTSSKIDYSKTNATDIRFYDDNGISLLPKETELWNSSGNSYVWVKVPRINANSNADYVYAYYGCTDSNADNKNGLWDSSFKIVHHLSESSGMHYDSSPYANNATVNGATQNVAGKIGGADWFDGDNDYVQINDGFSLNSNQITFSAWVNLNGSNYAHSVVGSWNSTNGYNLIMPMYPQTNWIYFYVRGTDSIVHGAYATSCPTNQWVQITETYNGSVMKVYLNGAERPEATTITSFTIFTFITAPRIGETEYSSDRQYFKGTIDEVRVSNVTKSAAWINASYLSETDSFTSFGSEQDLRNTNLVGNDCNYRAKFTFNNLWNPENLTNFPILVKLSPARIDYAKTSATDLRFYDADTITLLPKETELWNSSGDSYIWVKVPQIDAGTNADYIYAYYGCSNENPDSKTAVWDSNFRVVQHLGETSSTHYDSTSYGNNGTASSGVTHGSGKIGRADGFNFNNNVDNVDLGNDTSLWYTNFTIEGWAKPLTGGLVGRHFVERGSPGGNRGYLIQLWSDNGMYSYQSVGGNYYAISQATPFPYDSYFHRFSLTFTYNGSDSTLISYVDGAKRATTSTVGTPDAPFNTDKLLLGYGTFNGTLDEIRVSSVPRSAYWINASYLSENDTFINYGIEESGVSGTYSCSSTVPKKARLIERIGYLKNGTDYTPIKVKIWTW